MPSSARADRAAAATPPERPGLLARLAGRAGIFLKLDIPLFFYLNFLCRNVHRERGCLILPFRGTRLRFSKTATINLRGRRLLLNNGKLPRSRQECTVSLADGAVWDANGDFRLKYGASVGIGKNAHLTTGDNIGINTGSSIGCNKKIVIGNNVAIGGNVTIFDTDFHPRYNSEGKRANADRETIIEDNVWIATKSTIMKGTHIGTGSVIAANSLVTGRVPPRSLVAPMPSAPILKDIGWER